MERLMSSNCHTPSSMKFRGIPWNCSCQRNWRNQAPLNSMEFRETARVIDTGAIRVPWNVMDFHATARVIEIGPIQVPWNSMELLMSAKWAHAIFHGIPLKCSCQRNWRTQNSMEFHGTTHVREIGALQVPWNSMKYFLLLFIGTICITNTPSLKFW